jgi:hypothetical protein
MTVTAEDDDGSEWAPLMDVTQESVSTLIEMQKDVLALCLQRMLKDLDDPHGVISGFNNVP